MPASKNDMDDDILQMQRSVDGIRKHARELAQERDFYGNKMIEIEGICLAEESAPLRNGF